MVSDSATRASSGLSWTGLCTRLDGSPAAANTITRKRAVFHGALGYAVELGLLPANPIGLVRWRAPRAAAAVSPATVASPAQVPAILTQAARVKPELAAFFGCLYYAALRPEEAVTLRRADGRKTPSASGSKMPLTQAPPSRIPHHARKRTVIRTVGTAPNPVRYMYANQPEVPRIAHGTSRRSV